MKKIEPAHATHQQAQILKEKGFDENVHSYYMHRDEQDIKRFNGAVTKNGLHCDIPRPEQWQVIEWLRIKHNINIWVEQGKFCFIDNDNHSAYNSLGEFKSPQAAYSAAFDYILNEMI